MHAIHIIASVTSADSASVAQWIGEALANEDVRDSHRGYVIHSVTVEEEDA